jgi:hypothetical protein
MKTSIVERAVVYAVIDGTVHSDRDGLIQAICPDRTVEDRESDDEGVRPVYLTHRERLA